MRRLSSATSSRRSAADVLVFAAALALGGCGSQSPAAGAGAPAVVAQSTDHLTVSATLAPAAIAPGGRVVLTAEITPKTGMHVYAPGSKYRAVTITLPEGSRFRLESPLEYPQPVLYTFTPLNEQVLVYDAPFRLVAPLGLDPAPRAVTTPQQPTSLPLRASLEYQACDDRVCYLPESVDLRWTVTLLRTAVP